MHAAPFDRSEKGILVDRSEKGIVVDRSEKEIVADGSVDGQCRLPSRKKRYFGASRRVKKVTIRSSQLIFSNWWCNFFPAEWVVGVSSRGLQQAATHRNFF